ncbi:hypothetical protein Dda_2702 [Drechslerella dactyloides]|uniref:Uncharacterized protein n=1 Tax=Drechslerella dactyloides TaxID=74499 RepID=A0AAD6J018_DREDA|nr:hypothetical protein Dda_2702 [Drechslerella dactyloides]
MMMMMMRFDRIQRSSCPRRKEESGPASKSERVTANCMHKHSAPYAGLTLLLATNSPQPQQQHLTRRWLASQGALGWNREKREKNKK